MTYKPTFTVSEAKRPWHQRLTPVAWVLIAVGLLAALACVGVGIAALLPDRQPSWEPTPTVAPSDTPAPTPTAGATAEPTEGPTATAGPTPTPLFWWGDLMTEDSKGHLLPPQEVQDQVWEAFIGGLGCSFLADRGDEVPEETYEELVRRAGAFLVEDPEVWQVACNGAKSLDEALVYGVDRWVLDLAELGPRNPAICDDSPTRCVSAVAVDIKGIMVFSAEPCQGMTGADPPCIVRPPKLVIESPFRLFVGTLEWDERTGQWRIVSLEREILPQLP